MFWKIVIGFNNEVLCQYCQAVKWNEFGNTLTSSCLLTYKNSFFSFVQWSILRFCMIAKCLKYFCWRSFNMASSSQPGFPGNFILLFTGNATVRGPNVSPTILFCKMNYLKVHICYFCCLLLCWNQNYVLSCHLLPYIIFSYVNQPVTHKHIYIYSNSAPCYG